MFKRSLLSIAIISTLAAGCSNDDPSGGSMDVAAGNRTIEGSVAKGIVKFGNVSAYELNSEGDMGNAVGTAITDEKGHYSLLMDVNYDGVSPLLIELTAGDSTLMVCDSRDDCGSVLFGEDIPLAGTAFKLSAVSPAVANDDVVNTSITAFTSMAAANARAGTITDATVAAANSKVSQLVGVNITTTNPVNIDEDLGTASADAQQYTIMLAALAEQAFDDSDGTGVDITEAITNLAAFNTDFEDGVMGDANGLSPSELYADVLEEVAESEALLSDEATTSTNQLASLLANVADNSTDGTLTPGDTIGDNIDAVAQAKSFVTEVRTWATALQNLESPAELFLDEASTISDTLDSNSQAVLEVLAMALEAVSSEISEANDADRDVASSIQLIDDGASIGTIDLTDTSLTDSSTTIVMSADDLNGVSMAATVSVNLALNPSVISAEDKVLSINGSVSNSSISIALDNAAFTILLTEGLDTSDEDQEPSIAGMSLKGKLTATVKDNDTATGEMIVAEAEISFVALDSSVGESFDNDMNISLQKFALKDLTATNAAGSTAGLSVSLEMNNATTFDTLSYLNNDSVVTDNLSDDNFEDFDVTAAETQFGIRTFQQYYYGNYWVTSTGNTYFGNFFTLNPFDGELIESGVGTCASGFGDTENYVDLSCIAGDVSNLNEQLAEKYSSYQAVSTVSLKDFSYSSYNDNHNLYGYLEIELKDLESAENFLDATLTITGNVDLVDYPSAALSVTANKTGLKNGDLTGTLEYDGKILTLTANTAGGEEENTDALLSFDFGNPDGTKMSVSNEDDWITGNVTVGDEEVGTIEDLDGNVIIRYSDGTFESL